jgi:hypothetical protein
VLSAIKNEKVWIDFHLEKFSDDEILQENKLIKD